MEYTADCPAMYALGALPTPERLALLPQAVPARRASGVESGSNETAVSADSTLGPASSTGHRGSRESAVSVELPVALSSPGAGTLPKDDGTLLRSANAVVGVARRSLRGMGRRLRTLTRHRSPSQSPPPPATALEALARKAERRLQRLPEGERAALEPLRDAMLRAVHGRDLTPEVAAVAKGGALGWRLREAEEAAEEFCVALCHHPDVAAVVAELLPAARLSGDQLLGLLRDHLAAVGQGLAARDVPADLLPARGCRLPLEEPVPADVYHTASALCALQIVALLRLRRTLGVYCDFAQRLVERTRRMEAEDPAARAVAAAARAAKRDICLLAGTCTHLMLAPFYQLLPLVQCATLPPKQ
eukprot:EG_transcript_16489